jgi:hypothetical protein
VGGEVHEEYQEAEVVSVLGEEGAAGVVVFPEVVAPASLHEDEAVREVASHGDVVNYLIPWCCILLV